MAKLRPQSWYHRVTAGESVFETLLALGVIGTGVINWWKSINGSPPEHGVAYASLGLSGTTGFALLARTVLRNRAAQGDTEVQALDGVLHTLHAILSAGKYGHNLRICLFIPHHAPNTVHQVTNYVGVAPAYGRGRDLPNRCGIVGKAFRTGQAQYDKLPNNVFVVDHLVARYGFDRTEAAAMRQDRKSWAAVPVGLPGKVVGVLFLDSSERDFFGTANSARRKTLEAATIGVAEFIARF